MASAATPASVMNDVRHRAFDLIDRRYDLIHQIRREPMKAMGIVFGAGVLLGAIAGLACTARGRKAGDVCASLGTGPR